MALAPSWYRNPNQGQQQGPTTIGEAASGEMPAPMQDAQPQQVQTPEWDRTKFRDAWMSSGIQNVPDMQNWLRTSGWGGHVGAGGSKGDKMYLPGGETIDAVLGAGMGGNIGGPQWTGAGNWQQEGRVPFQGGPQMPQWGGGGNWGMYGGGVGRGIGPSQMMMQGKGPGWMQNMQNKMFQNQQQQRMQHRPGGIGPGMGGMSTPWVNQYNRPQQGGMNRQQMMQGMPQQQQQPQNRLRPNAGPYGNPNAAIYG